MKPSIKRPKAQQICFTIPNQLLDKLDELLTAEGAFLSRGAIIRAAVLDYYDSHRPKYIYDRSAKDKEKRQSVEFEKKFEDMTDLEYAETCKGLILNNRKGEPYITILGLGRSLLTFPVKNIKKWRGQEGFDFQISGHLEDLEKGENVEQRLRMGGYIKNFSDEFDIDLKAYFDEQDKRNNNKNTGLAAVPQDSSVEA